VLSPHLCCKGGVERKRERKREREREREREKERERERERERGAFKTRQAPVQFSKILKFVEISYNILIAEKYFFMN
jgi:hypothetical protein